MTAVKNSLIYLTNQMNLQEILTTGLIKPKQGYPPDKYYRDVLEWSPAGIPLFLDRLPEKAVGLAIAEQDFLTPVGLRIDGTRLAAKNLPAMDPQGRDLIMDWAPAGGEKPAVMVVKGVLPVCLVKDICFGSTGEKNRFLDESRQIANLAPELFRFKAHKGLGGRRVRSFPGFPGSWSEADLGPNWTDYLETEARGGVWAALFKTQPGLPTNIALEDPSTHFPPDPEENKLLSTALMWLEKSDRSPNRDPESKLLRSLLDYLAAKEYRPDPPGRGLIRVLETEAGKSRDAWRAVLLKAIPRIKRLIEIGDEPAEEFLEKNTSPVLGGLYLFYLRKNSRRLYRPGEEPLLKKEDLLAAQMLCGAWEGWTELIKTERTRELQNTVAYLMARGHNQRFGLDISLEPPAGAGTSWRQPRLF